MAVFDDNIDYIQNENKTLDENDTDDENFYDYEFDNSNTVTLHEIRDFCANIGLTVGALCLWFTLVSVVKYVVG